ncbi:MAG TPA: hypothetical protein PK858_07085, partial [Saprospiraceae bacterium]|nr:hypothetical protein [Saprospiraceae bacterium]
MLIKASGVTNLSDARYFAAREVRFLGFNLDEGSAGYVEPSMLHAIREWVEGPLIVGEFSAAPIELVREAASFYRLDAVQVSTDQHQPVLASLEGLTVLLHLPPDGTPDTAAELMRSSRPYVDFFVVPLDAPERVTRFTVPAFFQWHFAGLAERGNELVVHYVRYDDLTSFDQLASTGVTQPGYLHEAVVDPISRTV